MAAVFRVIGVLVFVMMGAALAAAHGDATPKRGGILQPIGEMDFELVVKTDKIDLYIYDHEEEMPTDTMSGVLKIIADGGSTKAELKPAGVNRLRAIEVTATTGDRVIAIVTLPDGQLVSIEFAIP